MSLTIFNDCKPWYIREGKNDTCLCRTCEDFRLAKKAVSYNYNVLRKPYILRPVARFMRFFYCAMKAVREYYGLVIGYKDPLMLTKGKLIFGIIQQFYMVRRTKTTIIELCCRGRNMEEIIEIINPCLKVTEGVNRCVTGNVIRLYTALDV
jgi:hypothetical protein